MDVSVDKSRYPVNKLDDEYVYDWHSNSYNYSYQLQVNRN